MCIRDSIGVNNNPESLQVFTDCSGFITSLFASANLVGSPTLFADWKVGSAIPEAGCFNPKCGCNKPNISNYYHFFTSGQDGGCLLYTSSRLKNKLDYQIFTIVV